MVPPGQGDVEGERADDTDDLVAVERDAEARQIQHATLLGQPLGRVVEAEGPPVGVAHLLDVVLARRTDLDPHAAQARARSPADDSVFCSDDRHRHLDVRPGARRRRPPRPRRPHRRPRGFAPVWPGRRSGSKPGRCCASRWPRCPSRWTPTLRATCGPCCAAHAPDTLVVGSHLDSVPKGGWLDGALGVMSGLELLRALAAEGTPPVTVALVDWADEEGARFSRSLFGSAASRRHAGHRHPARSHRQGGQRPAGGARRARCGHREPRRGAHPDGRRARPTSRCTSSRVRCSSRWVSASARSPAPRASSASA